MQAATLSTTMKMMNTVLMNVLEKLREVEQKMKEELRRCRELLRTCLRIGDHIVCKQEQQQDNHEEGREGKTNNKRKKQRTDDIQNNTNSNNNNLNEQQQQEQEQSIMSSLRGLLEEVSTRCDLWNVNRVQLMQSSIDNNNNSNNANASTDLTSRLDVLMRELLMVVDNNDNVNVGDNNINDDEIDEDDMNFVIASLKEQLSKHSNNSNNQEDLDLVNSSCACIHK